MTGNASFWSKYYRKLQYGLHNKLLAYHMLHKSRRYSKHIVSIKIFAMSLSIAAAAVEWLFAMGVCRDPDQTRLTVPILEPSNA